MGCFPKKMFLKMDNFHIISWVISDSWTKHNRSQLGCGFNPKKTTFIVHGLVRVKDFKQTYTSTSTFPLQPKTQERASLFIHWYIGKVRIKTLAAYEFIHRQQSVRVHNWQSACPYVANYESIPWQSTCSYIGEVRVHTSAKICAYIHRHSMCLHIDKVLA